MFNQSNGVAKDEIQDSLLLDALGKLQNKLGETALAQRKKYLEDIWQQGGKGFVERVKEYGRTERDKDNPIKMDPWQEEHLEALGDFRLSNVLTTGPSQCGKAGTLDSMVLTPSGWKRMGDIQPGDDAIAADGTPCKVVQIFPQGVLPIYRVTLSGGASTECCGEHLWLVQDLAKSRLALENTSHLIEGGCDYKIPVTDPANVWKWDWRKIQSIEYVGDKGAQCILIDHPSHLYVTDDYIVTHNTLGNTLLAVDAQTYGRFNLGWIYDSAKNMQDNQPTQFRLVADNCLAAMAKLGKNFDRSRDREMTSRFQVEGVTAVFAYASTSKATLRQDGQAAAGSAVVSFQADMLFLEERSQYPPGAADPLPRRLDASVIPTKPIRELGTPGSGAGIEAEFKSADYHFYPHYTCPHCGIVAPLDPKGCVLKAHTRLDSGGQEKVVHLSESGRPEQWWHTDEQAAIASAYIACSACGFHLPDEVRYAARFKCLKSGQWLRDFLDSLPKEVPTKRIKVGVHLSPLVRRVVTNLAAEIIAGGMDAIDPSDWQQQRLGHASEVSANSLTLAILQRAIAAPPGSRRASVRLCGIDQGRGQYWMVVADYCPPESFEDLAIEECIGSTIRNTVWAGDLIKTGVAERLKLFGVEYGLIDNEPERSEASELQRTTCLEMADQIAGLSDATKRVTVEDGGVPMAVVQLRNEKFLSQVLVSFLKCGADGFPLQRLPEDWRKWVANPSERSPLRHLTTPTLDVNTGKWDRGDGVDHFYYAYAFMEASYYLWLKERAQNTFIPGTLGPVKPSFGSVGGRQRRRSNSRVKMPWGRR